MKLSQFNVVHEHNGSLLIMNARTGGILSLNPEYAQKFKRIQEGDVRDAKGTFGMPMILSRS